MNTQELDPNEVGQVMSQLMADLAATSGMLLTLVGVRTGLWESLAAGPASPAELAARSSTAEPYVREWLRSQAAAGDIATLLARPGEPVRAAQLAGLVAPAGADPVLDDRARKAVTARIHHAIGRLWHYHPDLAAHLGAAVRTGTACTYQPAEPVDWDVLRPRRLPQLDGRPAQEIAYAAHRAARNISAFRMS